MSNRLKRLVRNGYLPQGRRELEQGPRTRKPLEEFVFEGSLKMPMQQKILFLN